MPRWPPPSLAGFSAAWRTPHREHSHRAVGIARCIKAASKEAVRPLGPRRAPLLALRPAPPLGPHRAPARRTSRHVRWLVPLHHQRSMPLDYLAVPRQLAAHRPRKASHHRPRRRTPRRRARPHPRRGATRQPMSMTHCARWTWLMRTSLRQQSTPSMRGTSAHVAPKCMPRLECFNAPYDSAAFADRR